ncbi:MAG: Trk system potassium transporter TrkA [Acholeplasmatales bacterium]|nr:Trk system potassium transporter TrkA [Acholeplasmatales bacterium]
MKVIVIGDGKVGRTIVGHICQEGHQVVVVDTDPNTIEEIVSLYDVMGICGNGASYDILKSAGAGKANLVVAATNSDETNILACLISQKLGAKSTIARVRNIEYSNQTKIFQQDLGITMTINPEREASDEIMKIVNFPAALRVDSFAKGNVDLVELYIPEGSPLIGQSLISIYQKYQIKVLVCAVQRNEEVFIPSGNFVFQAKDKIHITANSKATLRQFLSKSELLENKIKRVMIIGGGKIAVYLANDLLKNKYKVKIIERDYKRCVELSELLPGATIINGDGADQKVLSEEGFDNTDAIITLTGSDEENIIISMYAYTMNIQKIITKINKQSLVGLMESVTNSSVISPKDLTASKIISYVRAASNKRGSNVQTLYKLVNNQVEALEFIAKENKKLTNKPLKELKLKPNILIAGIIRDGNPIIPSGNDCIMPEDSVIVVTTNSFLDDLNDMLE